MKGLLNWLVKTFTWKTYASELQMELNRNHWRKYGWWVNAEHEEIGPERGDISWEL